jgi:hypothetical protein
MAPPQAERPVLCMGSTLSLRSVRARAQANARTTWSGAWTNKRLAGSATGDAGSGSALCAGSPVSLAAVGSKDQSDGGVAQRMGEAAASYSEGLSKYHSDSRSDPTSPQSAPSVVVLGVDGCVLGMQVRKGRRRLQSEGAREPLPAVETGHFSRGQNGSTSGAKRTSGNFAGSALAGAAVSLLVASGMPTQCLAFCGRDYGNWVGWASIPL